MITLRDYTEAEEEETHGVALVGLPVEGETTHNTVSLVWTVQCALRLFFLKRHWRWREWGWGVGWLGSAQLILMLPFSHSVCFSAAPSRAEPSLRGPGGWAS